MDNNKLFKINALITKQFKIKDKKQNTNSDQCSDNKS